VLASAPPPSPELDELKAQAIALVKARRKDVYALGILWNRLVVALKGNGIAGAGAIAWWTRNVPEDVTARMARMYGHVAAAFPEPVVDTYDVAKLNLLLVYCQLKGVSVAKDDPAAQPVAVPDKAGAVHPKPFAKCTERDLARAVRAARPSTPPKAGPPLPPGVAEAFAELLKNLGAITIEDEGFRLEPRMEGGRMRILLDTDANIFADVIAAVDQAGLSFNI